MTALAKDKEAIECFANGALADAGVDAGSVHESLDMVFGSNPIRDECLEQVDQIQIVEDNKFHGASDDSPYGFPERSNETAFPLSDILLDRFDRKKIEESCGPVLESVRKLLDCGLTCNPCGISKQNCSDYFELVRLGTAFSYVARNGYMSETNDLDLIGERIDICSDMLEFSSIAAKDGTELQALVSLLVASRAMGVSERLLNSAEDIPEEVLVEFVDRSSRSLGRWPNLWSFVETWSLGSVAALFSWDSDAQCWTAASSLLPVAESAPRGRCLDLREQDFAVMLFMSAKQLADAACSRGDKDVECRSKLSNVANQYNAYWSKYPVEERMTGVLLRQIIGAEDKDPAQYMVQIVSRMAITFVGLEKLASESLDNRFLLAGMRLLARYRLEYERTGHCPTEEFFARDDLKEFAEDPTSGHPMEIERLAPGRFVIRPSASNSAGAAPEDQPAIFIHCPFFSLGE